MTFKAKSARSTATPVEIGGQCYILFIC